MDAPVLEQAFATPSRVQATVAGPSSRYENVAVVCVLGSAGPMNDWNIGAAVSTSHEYVALPALPTRS